MSRSSNGANMRQASGGGFAVQWQLKVKWAVKQQQQQLIQKPNGERKKAIGARFDALLGGRIKFMWMSLLERLSTVSVGRSEY